MVGKLRGCAIVVCAAGLAARAGAQASPEPTAALLTELIRVNTSNPPGNEAGIAMLLAPRFKALGFEVDIVRTPDSAKAHFIARLRGDGSKRPVLLAAHADVVGVEREKWTTEPFAGVVVDGRVFGRGAIDFKGGMAVFARAVLMLAEKKVPLSRDVIFVAEADEEGGRYGVNWLARDHWPKIDAEFALNEGGWIMKRADGRVRYVSISTADKSSVTYTVTATGTSTHASMPLPDNAIFRLSRAMAKLADYETPVSLTASTRQFFAALGKTSAPSMAQHFRDLLADDPTLVRRADIEISKDPLLHALVRNTIAPVMLNAGFRSNVIPGSADATINARLLPGVDRAAFARELERVMGDSMVHVRVGSNAPGAVGAPAAGAPPAGTPAAAAPASLPSSENTELYQALVKSARVQWPEAEVTPYLFQAGTDAGAWRSRGVPVYGIYPYPIDADELSRMHGNDERVSVESLKQGTEMILRVLMEVAGKR